MRGTPPDCRSARRLIVRAVCGVVALVLLAGGAGAQTDEPFEPAAALYVGGGFSIPLGPSDFKDGWELGWNAGGGIGYQLSPRSEIRTLWFYNRFDLNPMGVVGVSGGEYTVVEILVDYKRYLTGLQPNDPLAFYVVGGIGFAGGAIASITLPDPLGTTEKYTETRHLYGLGGGVDFRALPRTAIFAEARWILFQAQGDNTTYLPLRAGIRFLLEE